MSIVDLRREGDVFVLTMNAGENRFNRPFVDAISAALDEIEGTGGPAALVTTGGDPKFYSNGLDLSWLSGDGAAEAGTFVGRVLRLLGRVLAFPVPTVAAINGHAFAAGGLLALAHDFRLMRADRGFFCLPVIDLGLPLAPGMLALIDARLTPATFRDSILAGLRIGGADAVARGFIDEALDADAVLPRAIERAASLAGKSREAYGMLKRSMYRRAIELLDSGEV